jgi:hypothetical protein
MMESWCFRSWPGKVVFFRQARSDKFIVNCGKVKISDPDHCWALANKSIERYLGVASAFLRQLREPKTLNLMIIHQPHSLHESVANRGSNKLEPSPEQVLAHLLRFRGLCR